MRRDEFLDEVCVRGGLDTRAEAELAVRVTLETLGGYLPHPIADNLAALLPRDIGDCLRTEVSAKGAFVEEMTRRTGAPPERAEALVTVVLGVVDDATDGAARAHLLSGVPGVPQAPSG
jgi:uncharacterized protein (DUF2267 family)